VYTADFLKVNSTADDILANLFSSTMGLGNKMKLKSRLLPFSVIRIQKIIMYIYYVLITVMSIHMRHINLNMTFYTYVEHSPTKQFT